MGDRDPRGQQPDPDLSTWLAVLVEEIEAKQEPTRNDLTAARYAGQLELAALLAREFDLDVDPDVPMGYSDTGPGTVRADGSGDFLQESDDDRVARALERQADAAEDRNRLLEDQNALLYALYRERAYCARRPDADLHTEHATTKPDLTDGLIELGYDDRFDRVVGE